MGGGHPSDFTVWEWLSAAPVVTGRGVDAVGQSQPHPPSRPVTWNKHCAPAVLHGHHPSLCAEVVSQPPSPVLVRCCRQSRWVAALVKKRQRDGASRVRPRVNRVCGAVGQCTGLSTHTGRGKAEERFAVRLQQEPPAPGGEGAGTDLRGGKFVGQVARVMGWCVAVFCAL